MNTGNIGMINTLWQIVDAAVSVGGHDMGHIRRVYRLAMKISAEFTGIDRDVLKAALILHDIARDEEDNDARGLIDHAILGGEKAEQILLELKWEPEKAAFVKECISTHRYRSSQPPPATLEAKILFDADKLDSLGAVGVGRLFMLSGQYGEQFYIEPPAGFGEDGNTPKIVNFEQYSPNLEYLLKMRHVPKGLFTEPARRIAEVRMERMDRFFAELRQEIME